MIKKLEEDLKVFVQELKKRDFYFYKTGVEEAKRKLVAINSEIKVFEDKIADYGYNMTKFGNADLITNSVKQVESIKAELENMGILWQFTSECLQQFSDYMEAKWVATNPYDMEEEVKRLFKNLKDFKCDKKCNAYLGILEDIKKWLVFLPLIQELRDDAMRDRHWQAIKAKV